MHNILTSKRIVSMAIALCLLVAFIVGCAGGGSESDVEVDIDFNTLSDVMMISMFVNMMNEPEQFMGQTIRMTGIQQTFHFEEYTFHYIMLLSDECCGDIILEFRYTEDTLMDDGVMGGNADVEVIGTFGQYPLRGHMFVYINAESVRFAS